MAKILVVDDEKPIRNGLAKLLNLDGHQVFTAENAVQGLKVFGRERPEIVLIDIKMPGMDGIEMLGRIKKHCPKTEAIIMTGHGGVESAIQALRKGASEYIAKPIEYDELAMAIKRALAKQKMERTQLIQSEKLAALGQLAAGVAHEINNPLTAISMNAAFLIDGIKGDEKKLEKLRTIEREADRAAAIVKSLLAFSRKSPDEKRETARLDDVMEEILKTIEHQLSLRNIGVVRDFAGDLPNVRINANQMQQVFLNLINNARDAMGDEGKITIRMSVKDGAEERRRNVSRLKEGRRMLLIEFSDTGQGIPAENLSRLFMPFFTTKEPGKGVGLGLYVSRSIVVNHGGEIEVESRPGEGATFRITLPTEV